MILIKNCNTFELYLNTDNFYSYKKSTCEKFIKENLKGEFSEKTFFFTILSQQKKKGNYLA